MNEKYVPLYRKYRPQKLEELVGQEHIKIALKNAIELNKISHAYLFTGPRGTGKTSAARIFAKSLNCKNGPTVSPCGECESCVDITNAVPMDVIEIDAASNRKVEDTQNILEKILYAPVYGKYKIYIIDEVHMLSNTAFNSLLKTLEEPPENVIFILATTEVHKVLDTIKSRCQRFDFRRITTSDIVKHLRFIADKEKIKITDDALFTIAKNSAGGMRDSIALLDQVSILNVEITSDDVNKLLGRISFDVLNKLADCIISSNPQNAVEILENIYNNGNEPVQILTNFLDYLKNLLISKNCKDDITTELTQLNDTQLKALKNQTQNIETHQIVALIDKCADYIKEIKLTNNPRLWLEVALIDMANLAENTKLNELQTRLSMLETGETVSMPKHFDVKSVGVKPVEVKPVESVNHASANPQPAKAPEPSLQKPSESDKAVSDDFSPMPKAKAVDNSEDTAIMWGKLLENIPSPPTKSLLKQWAIPVILNSEKAVISLKNEIYLKQFIDGNKRIILEKAVNDTFGHTNLVVRLACPEDKAVEPPKTVVKPKVEEAPLIEEDVLPTEEEIREIKEEQVAKSVKEVDSMHSDMVNMVVNLFDGKFIE